MKNSWRTNRQGLQWQLAAAGDGDGWPATATGGSPMPGIAGTGT